MENELKKSLGLMPTVEQSPEPVAAPPESPETEEDDDDEGGETQPARQ
jgi:hypothetical protein